MPYFDLLSNKHDNDILDMDIKLIKLLCTILSKSLPSVVDLSFDNAIVQGYWKSLEQHRYIRMGEINDNNNFRNILVISHIAKMGSTRVVDYLEILSLYPFISLFNEN